MGLAKASSSWKIVKLVFLLKMDAEVPKGIRIYRAIALTSVTSKWDTTCFMLRLEGEKKARRVEAIARGRNRLYQLPTASSNDDAAVTETLGTAGRQKDILCDVAAREDSRCT